MNSFSKLLSSLLAAALALLPEVLQADVAVGFLRISCPASADTIVSIPFRKAAAYQGVLNADPAIDGSSANLAVGDTPSWEADEFAKTPSYVSFLTGARAGHRYRINANSSEYLEVDLREDNFAGVAEGDAFEIHPYWTLDTLFPPATQQTIHASASVFASTRQTEVLLFDQASPDIALAPDRVYFITAGAWHSTAGGFPEAGDTILPPGSAFIIRQPAAASATSLVASQFVDDDPSATVFRTRTDGKIDHTLALPRPVPVALEELQLTGAGVFEESPSTAAGSRKDELLVYENAAAVINQQPSAMYFRTEDAWVKDLGGSFPNADQETIPAGAGVVVRKAASADGANHVWINSPSY